MLLQSSPHSLRKKPLQMYQYLFCNCHLVYILWRQCEIHQRQFQIPLFFCILFLTPLNKAVLILATQSKFLFESNYLKSTGKVCLSRYHLCQTPVKLLALSSHTTVDWKHEKYKCTMVYMEDSFIVSSFLFLLIHNKALLEGPVEITTGTGVENS